MRSCGFSSKCKASAQISLEGSLTRSAPSVSRSAAWNSRLRCVDFSARVAGAASFDALVSAFQIFWSMLVRSLRPVSLLPNLQLHRRSTPAIAPLENPLNRRKPTAIHIILVSWIGQQHHVFGGKIPGAWLGASSALSPVQIGAHSGPQLRDLVDRVGAYRERSQ